MRLWLCLRLDELPVQCLPQRRPGAVAVVQRQRVFAANAAATLLGIDPGMDLRSARAMAGDEPLQLLERDTAAETRALESLCCWAYGITPDLCSWHGDSLLLEIGGSLRLFGGSDAILRHCDRGLACRGFSASKALAATPLAAWLLSFDDDDRALDLERDLRERLATVPLARLSRLEPSFAALERSGIRQLGQVLELPAAALRKRCGADAAALRSRLDDSGEPPAASFQPPACFFDSYPLGYAVSDHRELAPALDALLQSLQAYLRQRQLQTRCIRWCFLGYGSYREELELRASSEHNQWQDWLRLTRLRLEKQPFRDAVEIVQLRCDSLEDARPTSGNLFSDPGQREPRERIVDVLSTRLGPQAVRQLRCRDAHLPEHSCAVDSATDAPQGPVATPASAQRPFWLLSDPEPLREDDDTIFYWGSPLTLLYGPERIEDGWWEEPVSRDYFVARNPQGQRFWVYYERRQRGWFLQGIFQ